MPNKDNADHRSNQKGNKPNAKSMSTTSFVILREFMRMNLVLNGLLG